MESDTEQVPPRQGRKRLRCVDQWKRKRIKIRKDSGKSYKTYKGDRRSSKQPSVCLSCRCQRHCSSRVSMAERERIFDDFYKLGDHDSQNKYLFGLIERSSPKQRRPRGATSKPRDNVFYYFEVEDNGSVVSHPGEYWMKSSFSVDEQWQKVCILKGRHKLSPPNDINYLIKYPDGHPINPKKVVDLQTMLPYLPSSCRDFYRSLVNHPVSHNNSDDHVMD